MKTEVMEKLRGARDFCALTRSLLGLCQPYGPVHALKLVHNRRAGRVVCFIEMESPKQQPALVRALGATVMEGSACLDIPVEDDFAASEEIDSALPSSFAVARSRTGAAPQASR